MDILLYSIIWQAALANLDIMFIFSKYVKGRIEYVRQVLKLLNDVRAVLKLQNGEFFMNCIDCIGHIFQPGRPEVSSQSIHALFCLQAPSNINKLLSFLGECNVRRRFVLNFLQTLAHVSHKVQMHEPCVYTEISEEELKMLHTILKKATSLTLLARSQSQGTYTVDTDVLRFSDWMHDAPEASRWTRWTRRILITIDIRQRGRVW